MKKIALLILTAVLLSSQLMTAQIDQPSDSTGMPGDHFSLQGALDLFKKSNSLEDFEQALNNETHAVNNLDLNQDDMIDYLRVEDHTEGDAHAIVIQALISAEESQDVAVIEIEKNGQESAILQIVGDQDLYGEEKIIEPFEEVANGGKGGPACYSESVGIWVNVWIWPCVRFVYGPSYRPWRSPYRWSYYPSVWRPWRVHPWRWHHQRCLHYGPGYAVVQMHRLNRAHAHYRSHRTTSLHVHKHYEANRVSYGKQSHSVKPKGQRDTKGRESGVQKEQRKENEPGSKATKPSVKSSGKRDQTKSGKSNKAAGGSGKRK